MKSVRNKLTKYLIVILSATGLFSCKRDVITFNPVAYGSPTVDLKISGKVTDNLSQPIEGILVARNRLNTDSTYTKADGTFEMICNRTGLEDSTELKFKDIDGPGHGGQFAEKVIKIKPEQTAADTYEAHDVNVTLEKLN